MGGQQGEAKYFAALPSTLTFPSLDAKTCIAVLRRETDMYAILEADVRGSLKVAEVRQDRAEAVSQATDPWLFTNLAAQSWYASRKELQTLERDIRIHAMYRGQWQPDELAVKRQMEELVATSVLRPSGAFGDVSPHPTIYRAEAAGSLSTSEWKLHFRPGDDVAFVPTPYCAAHPGITGPVRSGRFYITGVMRLCCVAYPFLQEQEASMAHVSRKAASSARYVSASSKSSHDVRSSGSAQPGLSWASGAQSILASTYVK